MLYTRIFLPKYSNFIRGITYSVFFAFLLSLSSCYTVSEVAITPQVLKTKDDYTILEAKLKNDSVIKLEEYNVSYFPKNDSTKGILRCVEKESVYSQVTGRKDSAQMKNVFDLKVNSISSLKIEIAKGDWITGYLIAGGIVAALLAIGCIIIYAYGYR